MSENFEQMLDASLKTIKNGEIIEGVVINVKEDEIALDLGYKSDGILTRSEYSNKSGIDLRDEVKIGDVLNVKILKVSDLDGQVSVSFKKANKVSRGIKNPDYFKEALENKTVLSGKVDEVKQKGLVVISNEDRVFIPMSLATLSYSDVKNFEGKEVEFIVVEFSKEENRLIGNRKVVLQQQKEEQKQKVLASIKVGDRLKGTVKSIVKFGAFVDLGGIDGLLHNTELGFTKKSSVKLVEGEEIEVQVKEIEGDKISLTCKFAENDPWANIEEKYKVDSVVKGKVARTTKFGAFVELEDGVDALLHISQISLKHIEKVEDELAIGQEIEVKVMDVNKSDKKISLSRKAILSEEKAEEVEE